MKNKKLYQMKKAIIVTLLAVICFFIPATSIAADDNIEVTAVGNLSMDNPYEVTIPVSVSVDSSTKKASFKVTGDIYKNQEFSMSVSSKNNYKLTAGSENLSYSLDKTSFNYTTSSSLDSFEDTVNVTVSGTTKTAGSFSDTLTFTIKCETNSAAVTFDNNDGSGTITTLNIAPGSTFGTLPTPTRTDYKFNGWYYLDSNNNKCYITSTDTYSGAVTTFYADWISLKPVLQYGYTFNNNIPDTATSVNFANYRAVPDSVTTTDVSANQDGSILAWMEGTTMYVSPKYEGATIMANSNCTSMFAEKRNLTSIELNNFNTSKVTTMQSMFYNCEKITDLDVSNFNTSNVTNMTAVFSGCKALTSLDVSNFNTSKVKTMESMFYDCSSLTTLDLSKFDTSNVTKMKSMFNSCSKLTSLDVSNFNTSNVTDMSFMFLYCNSLTALDVSNFDTSKVTTMEDMFYDCRKVTDLNVSSFDTSNVTNMSMMFGSCEALASLDVSNFDTSKVTTMKSMFYNCDVLTSLDVSCFNTSKVTTMENMFLGCDKLKNISLGSDFNTSNVTNMANMFAYCEVLEALDLSNFDTSKVTTMKGMFDYCNALTSLDLSNFDTFNVTNMYRMFYACLNLATLNVSSFDTSNVTNMGAMFGACEKLTSLNISNFSTEKVTNMYGLFYGDRTLTSLDLSSFNTSSLDMSDTKNYDLFFYACDNLNTISVGTGWVQAIDFPDSGVASAGKWYANFGKGTEYAYNAIPMGVADTYNINNCWNEDWTYELTDDTYIWLHAYKGSETTYVIPSSATIDGKTYTTKIGYWKTTYPYVQLNLGTITSLSFEKGVALHSDLTWLFNNNQNLASLDLSNLDTSNVTTMNDMFSMCSSLTSLDLSSFDTSNVTDIANMFAMCSSLTSLDLSNFNTNKVVDMYYMFFNCSSLMEIKFGSNFNTSAITDMGNMFSGCSSLTTLDLSSFNTSAVTIMGNMFYNCSKLATIYVSSSFTTDAVTLSINMFKGCSNLIGGNGTVYNSSYIDKTYARIDTSSKPGYFALKSSTSAASLNYEAEDDTTIVNITNLTKTYSNTDFTLNSDSAIEIASLADETSEETMPYYHLNNDEDLNSLLAMNVTSISVNGVMASENAKYDDTKFALEQSEDGILTITSIMDDGYPSLDDWKALIYSDIFTDINENVTISISVVNLTQDTEISGFAFVEDTEKETDPAVSSVPSDDSGIVSWDSTGEIVILEQVEAKSEEGAETTAPTEDVAKEELPALDTQEASKQSATQAEQEIVE